ncbi:MAG TPA: hypothetical protein VKQ72_06335, partial [Aggregatilineales bacterium]|nr:hypothetical protein [Aggregatilineales bacterium]
ATWAAIFLSDQFNDDLLDWEDDLQHGRYTLPLLLAAQAEGDSVEALPGLRQAEIKRRLDKYGILPQMSDKALALLEGAKADLLQLNLGGTRLCAFVDKRLAYTLETKRRLHAATIFNQLANLLTQP